MAVHMIVNGQKGFHRVYDLLVDIPGSMHREWMPNFLKFAMDAYIYRVENGDRVYYGFEHTRKHLKSGVERALDKLSDSFTQSEKEKIRDNLDYILSWIKEQEENTQ